MGQKTQEEREREFTLNYAYAMCDRSQQADRQFGHTSQCLATGLRPQSQLSVNEWQLTLCPTETKAKQGTAKTKTQAETETEKKWKQKAEIN